MKITYFDQNGNKLGDDTVAPGSEFTPKYTVKDLPAIEDGMAFRGWFTNAGIKLTAGTKLEADTRLNAKVTAIEKAVAGTHYDYDLTKSSWYQEDHELITIDGNYYNNHGWLAKSIKLDVSSRAVVLVKNCLYSAEQEVVVTDADGN